MTTTTLNLAEMLEFTHAAESLTLVALYHQRKAGLEQNELGSYAHEAQLWLSLIEDELLERQVAHLLGRCVGCCAELHDRTNASYCSHNCEAITTAVEDQLRWEEFLASAGR